MRLEIKSYSSSSSLLNSIFFLLLGAVFFTNPEAVESFISYFLGGILVFIGLVKIFIYWRRLKSAFPKSVTYLYFALLLIAVAITFIFFAEIITNIIKYFIGAWIVYLGINRLILVIRERKGVPLFVLSILLILLGLGVMLIPNIFIKTIGLMIMIYSGIDIIGYIFYNTSSRREPHKPQEGTTTLIIPEKPARVKKEKKSKKKVLIK